MSFSLHRDADTPDPSAGNGAPPEGGEQPHHMRLRPIPHFRAAVTSIAVLDTCLALGLADDSVWLVEHCGEGGCPCGKGATTAGAPIAGPVGDGADGVWGQMCGSHYTAGVAAGTQRGWG